MGDRKRGFHLAPRRTPKQSAEDSDWRIQQSFSSVTNNPNKPRSISDFLKDLKEIVNEEEEKPQAIEESLELDGAPVPQVEDFQPYFQTFQEVWAPYALSHREAIASEEEEEEELEEVPEDYFQEDFDLGDLPYFEEDIRRTVRLQGRHSEELSGYMDTVEVALFQSIRSAQVEGVFDSMADYSTPICDDIAQALVVVKNMRRRLHAASEAHLQCGAVAARLARRRARVAEVLGLLEGFSRMQQLEKSVESMVENRAYVEALRTLEKGDTTLEKEMGMFTSVSFWSSRLSRLGRTVAVSVQADFVQLSTEVLLDTGLAVANVKEELEMLCWCLKQRKELRPILGLSLRNILLSELKGAVRLRVQQLLEELTTSKEEVTEEQAAEEASAAQESTELGMEQIQEDETEDQAQRDQIATPQRSKSKHKSLFRKVKGQFKRSSKPSDIEASPTTPTDTALPSNPEMEDMPTQPTPTAASGADIASSLSGLSTEGFAAFWEGMLQFAADVAEHLGAFAELVQRVAGSVEEGVEAEDLRGELVQLGDSALEALLQKVGVLLQARKARQQELSVPQMRQLMAQTSEALERVGRWSSCVGLEQERKLGAPILATLAGQTRPIVQAFHQQSLLEVQAALEAERWERADVPPNCSQLLAEIVGSACAAQRGDASEAPPPQEEEQENRCVHFRGLRFLVVPAALTLISLLAEYVRLCRDWSACGPQVLWCVGQLLRAFNQQARGLVLGGQAVHSQVLKKINATHLALCCQCCSLMEAVLPPMQEMLLQILVEADLEKDLLLDPLADLSKVVSDFVAHRDEVFEKLAAILRERYDHHSKRWLGSVHAEQDCSLAIIDPQFGSLLPPHAALEGLVKDVVAMHTVLSKCLSHDSLQKVFTKAFAEIAGKFEQKLLSGLPAPYPPYEGMEWRSLGDRLLVDVVFLREHLGSLPAISLPLQHFLSDLVQHICRKLPPEDPLRQAHPSALESLQRAGKLPP